MKKNFVFKLFFLIFSFFLCITFVNAEECSTEELRELKQLAKKVEFSYRLDEATGISEVFVHNFSNKFYIKSPDIGYIDYLQKKQSLGRYSSGFSNEISIYASEKTKCYDYKLTTVKFEVPYYNQYSKKDVCSIYREFDLCKKWFDTSGIYDEEFEQKLELYKKSISDDGKINFFLKIINFVKENYIPILSLVVISGVIFLIYKFIRQKKRTKIDLEVR